MILTVIGFLVLFVIACASLFIFVGLLLVVNAFQNPLKSAEGFFLLVVLLIFIGVCCLMVYTFPFQISVT